MARPSNWIHSPTAAIRVPEQFAAELLSIAKQMDEGKWVDKPQNSVQNILESIPGLSVGDRVRLHCNGQDLRWHGKEAEVVGFPFVRVRCDDREFVWSADSLEPIAPVSPPALGEIAAAPADGDGLSPADSAMLDRLVDKALAECDRSGVAPEKLLLYLKGQELREFLSHFRPQDRKEFAVSLLDEIFGEEREVVKSV